MPAPPKLTDRPALVRARSRARSGDLFLHEIGADEIQSRLKDVNRTFTAAAIVTGHPAPWRARFPDAAIVPDEPTLALSPGAHDLVILGLSLHWSDDMVGQMIQARRALRPDGLLLGVTMGGRTLSELRAVLGEAEIAHSGGLSPRVAPMAEIRDLGALLQRAGLALPVADADLLDVSYADLHTLAHDLRAMGETNALADRLRRPTAPAIFRDAAGIYARSFPHRDDPARIRATYEFVYVSGWAPAETQPKPLRPGTAKARLADALGTPERPLRDDLPDREN